MASARHSDPAIDAGRPGTDDGRPGGADPAAGAVPRLREDGIGGRDPVIDGFRALAVAGVVAGHALAYRYADLSIPGARLARRFAGPLSDGGVQLFFVISGYIITSLMLREEARTGRVGIAAFYARRVFRILPPLLALLATLATLAASGYIAVSPANLASALLFSCNTALGRCNWWVAHSWSLAVEEQFYIVWPLLFAMLVPRRRPLVAAAAMLVLLLLFAVRPPSWHSNYLSFACIAAGAAFATSPGLRRAIRAAGHGGVWLAVAALLLVAPLTRAAAIVDLARPLLLLYLLFVAGAIAPVRTILTARPVQWVGLASYSLYLWQQLFLANPALYRGPPPPVLLLPAVVWLSVMLVERPFIRVGHRLSQRLQARGGRAASTDAGSGPAASRP